MKLSLNWIRDYVKIPDNIDLTKLAYELTMSTVEVEGAYNPADALKGVIVGVINEVLPHPNADKLRICKTDIGGEVKDIVCGGSNLYPGMKVAVACPGAIVRWHGEGEPVEIKNAKLRGVESFGMICASVELGLAELLPAKEEHEIIDLSNFDAAAGESLAKVLLLDDIILEIDNKSMTNRPDLWGHYGIAREIAALYDLPLVKAESYSAPSDAKPFDIKIEDTDGCPRYIGAVIEGLSVKSSPYEIQSRIFKVGMRPINALVDITNYVMLATGQPTHAFDADNISDYIAVRGACCTEALTLLNGKELSLSKEDLVIADSEGAVALAGVMGGAKDSIGNTTSRVILEVANFDAKRIRRSAQKYDNRTEASARYEKAIDPERCDLALSFAMELFAKVYPEMRVTAFSDKFPKPLDVCEIDVDTAWLRRRLGKDIPKEIIEKKLGALGFKVEFSENNMHLVVPSYRATGDVSIKADIMEEVARMYGYENFEPTSITTTFDGAINQLDVDLVRKIKEYLAFRCNMQEIFTYPWMSDECVNAVLGTTEGILALATPPSPNEKFVKSSLLPNICRAIVKNERNFDEFRIFEEASVFVDGKYSAPYDEKERLPYQRRHLGCAFVGKSDDIATLYREAKGVIENMSRYTHMESFTFKKCERPYFADEVVWQNIYLGDEKIGDIALLSKKSAMACGIKVLSAVLVEIDMDMLKPYKSRTNKYEPISEFPLNDYDVSMLVDSTTKWEDIYSAAASKISADSLLRDVIFVDEYHGKQVPDGKKSITVRLVIGSNEKTLTSAEIESCAASVIKRLGKMIGAETRVK